MFHPHLLLRTVQRSQIFSSLSSNKLVSLIFLTLILPEKPKQTKTVRNKKKKKGNVVRIVMIIKITKNKYKIIFHIVLSAVFTAFNEATQILADSLIMLL